MTATVRLDDTLTEKLNKLSHTLHQKKSDVIRDAICYYAQNVEAKKKSKILSAVEKVKEADKLEYEVFEGTINDGI